MTLSYCGLPSHWAGQEPRDVPPANVAEALARIDQLYRDGIPFFTKDSIRAVSEQLKRPHLPGDKISVKGVDGATVEFEVKAGTTRQRPGPEHEVQELAIEYYCRVHLKLYRRLELAGLHLACCSLQIYRLESDRNGGIEKPTSDDFVRDAHVVADFFHDKIRAWEESAMCKQLRAILTLFTATHEISHIIGLACGPMSLETRHRGASRSAFQHALLLTIRECLRERDRDRALDAPCYAQDPAYTAVDAAVLAESNIQVVADPQGWLEIDDSSVVFTCAPDVPVKDIVADLARPAVVIWERVGYEDGETGYSLTCPDSPRVRAMVDGYDQYDFGPDDDHFTDLVVYIRRATSL